MKLYPLKFKPIYKQRLWGGNKLKSFLHKDVKDKNIGESWEISDVNDNQTLIVNGCYKNYSLKKLIQEFKSDIVGNNVYSQFGDNFPLLIKFIDAKKKLSIQVHPNNEYAKKHHNSFGKNEMWYVVNAKPKAEIIIGFDNTLNKEQFKSHINNNTVLDVLHKEKVKSGDVFYIPSGRIHAIGEGVLLAEIQQTSDITYRVYDYNRIDEVTGKKRNLHIEKALDVINYSDIDNFNIPYEISKNDATQLVHTTYFKTNLIHLTKKITRNYSEIDSFKIYMCVEGDASYTYNKKTETLSLGETILVPNALKNLTFEANQAKLLEVYY